MKIHLLLQIRGSNLAAGFIECIWDHSCFVEKYKMRAVQWENDFNTFFANNSQYIMIFLILQQRGGMLVVLGGHLVNIGDGYWWFKLNLLISY